MRRIQEPLLRRMAAELSDEDRDELAIPSYLHGNPALRWMAWRRVEVVARRLQTALAARPRPTTVIDFGCGTGVLLAEASRHAGRVIGVDPVLTAARLLVREWGLDHVELMSPAEAEADVAPGSVDVILAAEVLEHVEPLAPALARFERWLRPDGLLLVSLPTENAFYRFGRRLAGFSGHYHHANAASIHREILAAGFRQQRLETVPVPRLPRLSIYWVIEYRRP